MEQKGQLSGMKVLDLSRVLAAPYCGMMLADLGAEVIKIERPGKGDDARSNFPIVNGESAYYMNLNRNKRGIVLNLKSQAGKEVFRKLVAQSDVVLENYRPGVMDRLGLGYEELRKINPAIIYASVSGFGHYGPYHERAGYDIVGQAISGLMSTTGWPDSAPTRTGTAIADVMGGISCCVGILAAYINRLKTGEGEKVDVYDFYGVRIGIFTKKKDDMINLYSKQIISSTDPYLWMNAAEVTFLRAEGALRGWAMGGEAQALYEKAVSLSFDERKASGADAYVKDDEKVPADYVDPMGEYSHDAVSTITIAWEPGAANFEKNLERIITQKWIAIFPLGVEAWAEHRRTGYPKLLPVVENKDPNNSVNVTIGPRRLPFPADEYNSNPTYIGQAVQMLNGPDAAGTRLWWDVKNHSGN